MVPAETLQKFPDLEEQLDALSVLMDDDIMAGLNARVDVDGETIERVAENFLREHGLL